MNKREPKMNKLIKGGKVAVVISPGYGAGWSTWNEKCAEFLLFDADIAQALLDGNKTQAMRAAKAAHPDIYCGGVDTLEVVWVAQGVKFTINEYDGHESILTFDDLEFTA